MSLLTTGLFTDLVKRRDLDPLIFQRTADLLHEEQRFLAVPVHAHGIRLDINIFSGNGGHFAFLHHAHHAGDGLILIADKGAFFLPVDEASVLLIAAVREHFTASQIAFDSS